MTRLMFLNISNNRHAENTIIMRKKAEGQFDHLPSFSVTDDTVDRRHVHRLYYSQHIMGETQ